MLTSLTLNNFKIWDNTKPIRLGTVTLLLGTNSSGKSSLIQSLLLLRQTTQPHDDWQPDLDFGSGSRNSSLLMGSFREILCRHGNATSAIKANQVGLEFSWKPSGEQSDTVTFSARYSADSAIKDNARIDYLRLGKYGEGFTVERETRATQDVYKLTLGDRRNALGRSILYKPVQSFSFSKEALAELGDEGKSLESAGEMLLKELSRVIYLGPLREMAQRHYPTPGTSRSAIDDDGTNAPALLIASALAHRAAKNKPGDLPETARLFEQTCHWLKEMGLADKLAIKQLPKREMTEDQMGVWYEIRVEVDDESSNLRDVGVGVSQVLPVIVAALTAESGHIVIVEEPESHLHPLAQAGLAELFAQVSRDRNVQFIVETHSEHLFRRMQTLIAQDRLSLKEAAMYFVERMGKRAEIRPLEISDKGRIANWPDKFFGDSAGEAKAQALAALERLKSEQE